VAQFTAGIMRPIAYGSLIIPVVAVITAEYALTVISVAISATLSLVSFILLKRPRPENILRSEVLMATAFGFIILSLAFAPLFYAGGLSGVDAIFESVSGITTTGLTVMISPEGAPVSNLAARSLLQWFGGYFILAAPLALFVQSGEQRELGAVTTETTGQFESALNWSQKILLFYGGTTILAAGIIFSLERDLVTAATHALSSVSTGGYSNYADSLAGMQSRATPLVVSFFSVLGAIPFAIYLIQTKSQKRKSFLEAAVLIALIGFFSTAMAVILLAQERDWSDALFTSITLSISTQTTTGYASETITALPPAALALLVVSMIIGGATGSTAGGVKPERILILFRVAKNCLDRTISHQHAILKPRLGGEAIDDASIEKAILISVSYAAAGTVTWIAMCAHGYDAFDSLFDTVSALSTVGLSTGVAGPEAPASLKFLLCADMLLGRLEFVALLVLLSPTAWGLKGGQS